MPPFGQARVLENAKIDNLLRRTEAKDHTPWSADAKIRKTLAVAFDLRATEIDLNGREFSVTYKGRYATVKPIRGFTPCGSFDIEGMKREHEQAAI